MKEGDSANLTCKIIESFPEPQLTIFKNEDPQQKTSIVEYGDLLFDDTKGTLTLLLTNVTERVKGRYTCKAENAGGNFTESLYLRVRSKLIIIVMHIVTIKCIKILYCLLQRINLRLYIKAMAMQILDYTDIKCIRILYC